MLKFMWQKLSHKKWMVISLLIGNILLVSIAASHPMYEEASLKRMLKDEFIQYIEDTNRYPAQIQLNASLRKEQNQAFYQVQESAYNLEKQLSVSLSQMIEILSVQDSRGQTVIQRYDNFGDMSLQITSMSDLEQHIKLLSGKCYSNELTEDGCIETIISESTMIKLGLLLGDEIVMNKLQNYEGNPIKLRVVGIFENSEDNDTYWVKTPDLYDKNCMISQDIFHSIFIDKEDYSYNLVGTWIAQIDYDKITVEQVPSLMAATNQLLDSKIGNIQTPNYMKILSNFASSQKRVSVTLLVLEVPVLALLCAFLYMISSQLLEMEQNEISQLKSRGAGRLQIFTLYLLQSVLLAAVSFVVGLPIGSFLCKALGSSNAFLEFVQRRPLEVTITGKVLIYAGCAVLASVFMTVVPVIAYSKVSIVNLKQRRMQRKKKIWQKLWLDVIAIGISLYGFYDFSGKQNEIEDKIFAGESLNPLLFLCASLFILGVGLFALRFQPHIIKFIFWLGKKRWKPASYSSFLQTVRTGTKQQFVMIFLIMTVALGIFNSTVARTIVSNAESNEKYNIGADLVVKEVWKMNQIMKADQTVTYEYVEPDFGKYKNLSQVVSIAKVFRDDNVTVLEDRIKTKVSVMGINTKDFGNTTNLSNGLLPYDYYDYLNVLASDKSAVLVSMNMHTKFGYKLGDLVTYTNSNNLSVSGKIYGFINYWPTYSPTTRTLSTDGKTVIEQNYLIIGNLDYIQKSFGVTPYEVWMKVDGNTDFFYDFIEENELKFRRLDDMTQKVQDIRREPLFQGTNGILTMSFIVILVLCCTGFLIYWILSIRSRELLFGVFRAMGMSRGEVLHMLINEQIFSCLYAIVAGAGVGVLSSRLFIPLIQSAYRVTNQVLPLELLTKSSDMVRLFTVIGIVFVGCIITLARIIFRMKISQALKLGED